MLILVSLISISSVINCSEDSDIVFIHYVIVNYVFVSLVVFLSLLDQLVG